MFSFIFLRKLSTLSKVGTCLQVILSGQVSETKYCIWVWLFKSVNCCFWPRHGDNVFISIGYSIGNVVEAIKANFLVIQCRR